MALAFRLVEQWPTSFLTLQLFDSVPHVVVFPKYKIIFLMPFFFATVMSYHVNMWDMPSLIDDPSSPPKGSRPTD